MDVSINKAVKNFLRQQFQMWYADQVCEQLAKNRTDETVDLKLSIVKPLRASWIIKACMTICTCLFVVHTSHYECDYPCYLHENERFDYIGIL